MTNVMGVLWMAVLLLLGGFGELAMPADQFVPFTADYDELKVFRNPDGGMEVAQHDRGRVCRDGRGRMRYDFKDDDVGTTVAVLIDPSSDRVVALDAASGERLDANSDRIAEHFAPQLLRRRATEDPSQGSDQFRPIESMNLGERVIEGLATQGNRTRLANGSVTEVWHAPSLPDFPVIASASGPSGREESKLHNIRIGEPDPELFKPLDAGK
jgi:hypothetical protein